MAMTGTMEVSSQELLTSAEQFSGIMKDVNTLTGRMCELVHSLRGKWETSDSSGKFYQRFDGLEDDMQRFIDMVREYAKDLTDIAAGTVQTETANTTEVEKLASDILV